MENLNTQVDCNQSPEKSISHIIPERGIMNAHHPQIQDDPFDKSDTSDDSYSFEEEEMLLSLLD